ncbi:hypothetical protein K440DRAFT_79894 [Wilcoxina mikolae CBS 423.85]|nr:hypothetical protein K440DRAFT_79894 [Wilcoxina mikolae CBS 423.85]
MLVLNGAWSVSGATHILAPAVTLPCLRSQSLIDRDCECSWVLTKAPATFLTPGGLLGSRRPPAGPPFSGGH